MEKQTLKISEVSELLGISQQQIRLMAQQRLLPFIVAVKKENGRSYCYHCFRDRLEAYLKGELS